MRHSKEARGKVGLSSSNRCRKSDITLPDWSIVVSSLNSSEKS